MSRVVLLGKKIHDPPLREVRRGQISCIRKRPGQPLQIVSKINPPTQSTVNRDELYDLCLGNQLRTYYTSVELLKGKGNWGMKID